MKIKNAFAATLFVSAQLLATMPVRAAPPTGRLSSAECALVAKGLYLQVPLLGPIDGSSDAPILAVAQQTQSVDLAFGKVCYSTAIEPAAKSYIASITPDQKCYDINGHYADAWKLTLVETTTNGSSFVLVDLDASNAISKYQSAHDYYRRICPPPAHN